MKNKFSSNFLDILEKREKILEALERQESLITSGIFNPYEYFGISQLSIDRQKLNLKKPSKNPISIGIIKKNCYSMINNSTCHVNTAPSLNSSFAITEKNEKAHLNEPKSRFKKPFHLKIDLQEYALKNKKNSSSSDIRSSRSASKITTKNQLKTPESNEKKNVFNWKKKDKTCINITDFQSKTQEKTCVKMKENKIRDIMKGLDEKYQNTYLSFVKASKSKTIEL